VISLENEEDVEILKNAEKAARIFFTSTSATEKAEHRILFNEVH
jgi:hypothetical protein